MLGGCRGRLSKWQGLWLIRWLIYLAWRVDWGRGWQQRLINGYSITTYGIRNFWRADCFSTGPRFICAPNWQPNAGMAAMVNAGYLESIGKFYRLPEVIKHGKEEEIW